MATTVYTYPFPGTSTFLGEVADPGTDLFPSDDLEPSDLLEAGQPPAYFAALYPGLSLIYAVFEDPGQVERDPAPQYQVLVCDTRTGRIGWELPYTKFQWNTPLNEAGSATFTVPIEQVHDYNDRLDERAPKSAIREIASGPWRFSFVLAYSGRVIWAGPLVAVKLDEAEDSVDFGCVELMGILNKRLLINPNATSVTDPSADVIYQEVTLDTIARRLVTLAVNRPGKELPIDLPPESSVKGGHQRFYYGYDLASIGDRLSNLTKVINGPDVRFDPYIVSAADGTYVRWTLNIGKPYLSTSQPWFWEHRVNATLDFDLDSKDMAFHYYTAGAGQDRDKKIGQAQDDFLVRAGFPRLEEVDTQHASASEIATLTQWAQGALLTYGQPLETWSLRVHAWDTPRLGDYRVGDSCSVGVHGHLLIEDGVFSRRITNMSGDETGIITLTGDPKAETPEDDTTVLGKSDVTEETVTVVHGTVPDAVWKTLLAWGYTGRDDDGMEALYVTRSTLAAAYYYQDWLGQVTGV